MTKKLTDRWFRSEFDRSWVRCRNFNCKSLFFLKDVRRKNKCPKCKLDNYQRIKTHVPIQNTTGTIRIRNHGISN